MESRYTLLNERGVRNLQEYNAVANEKLPYYVVVIDEYGDLILQSVGRDMERAICRIAQKARAVGIHMIISTQRPDAKIVTGSIKANFPTRIAFRTTTGTDSRVILDRIGAERLTGKGDMLFFNGGDSIRAQCAYISTEEVNDMCSELCEKYASAEQTTLPGCPQARNVRVVSPSLREYALYKVAGHDYVSGFISGTNLLEQLQEMGLVSCECDARGYEVLVHSRSEVERILDEYVS